VGNVGGWLDGEGWIMVPKTIAGEAAEDPWLLEAV
jgi:hypothetical protein